MYLNIKKYHISVVKKLKCIKVYQSRNFFKNEIAHFSAFRPPNPKVIRQFFLLLHRHFKGIKIFHFEEIMDWTHFRLIIRLTVKYARVQVQFTFIAKNQRQ